MSQGNMEVIFGPPGTGKTTELCRLAQQYAEAEGSDTLLLCAFTKTAAQELARRDVALEGSTIGTLHSICFHALDTPIIAETKYREWNETHPLYPLSPEQSIMSQEPGQRSQLLGDRLLQDMNILRHRCIPPTRWPEAITRFAPLWSDWKRQHGYQDFTDLLEVAFVLLPIAPGRPRTIIVDEAQDLSLLQWSLLRQWARHATRFIVAGDDDQCLYGWAGADFTPLLAASSRRVLGQSYRVPQTHQELALQYVHRITCREPKTWLPRAATGTLWRDADGWTDRSAGKWASFLQEYLDDHPTHTAICLAPCSYMLTPLLGALRSKGIPFGNRWRRRRGDWNPLAPSPQGTSSVQRLLAFLRPHDRLWTWHELSLWADKLLRTEGVLHRGAKARITLHAEEKGVCPLDALETFFLPGVLASALTGGADWLEDHLLQQPAKILGYPLRVFRQYGRQGLLDEPRLAPGSGHSFKGTEANLVLQFTDLSYAQNVARCRGGQEADDVYRMLYVASTRARETMILAGPHQSFSGHMSAHYPTQGRYASDQAREEDEEIF